MKYFVFRFFAVFAGVCALASPALSQSVCSASDGYFLDWNSETYTAESTTFSTTVVRDGSTLGASGSDPINIDVTFSGATGTLFPGFPQNSDFFNGGNGAGSSALAFANDFDAMDQPMFIAIEFSADVTDLTFDMFDIDFLGTNGGTGGFRDSVTITGTRADGSTALPVLTTPFNASASGQIAPSTVYVGNPIASNRAVGNPSNGNSNSGNGQNLGNVTIAFSDDIVRLDIRYETQSDFFTTTNPQAQGAALYDLDFCIPATADLTFEKVVSLHSEIGVDCGIIPGTPDTDPTAAIPGSCLQYDITVQNIGAGTSSATDVVDQLNSSMIFAGASFSGFDTSDTGFSFDTPVALTDCGIITCEVAIRDGILNSGDMGIITVRVILK